jgi:hypothetical protein
VGISQTRFITTRNSSGMGCARIIPYPTGRSFRGGYPRHFVPGYDRVVPLGQYELGIHSQPHQCVRAFFGRSAPQSFSCSLSFS